MYPELSDKSRAALAGETLEARLRPHLTRCNRDQREQILLLCAEHVVAASKAREQAKNRELRTGLEVLGRRLDEAQQRLEMEKSRANSWREAYTREAVLNADLYSRIWFLVQPTWRNLWGLLTPPVPASVNLPLVAAGREAVQQETSVA